MGDDPMVTVQVTLLGRFDALRGESGPVKIPALKARAMLAYLALRPGHADSRERVATLLWEDSAERQARASLRQTLSQLRKALNDAGEDAVIVRGETLRLESAAFDVDVWRFERLVARGTPDALEEAAALYNGDLLEDIAVDASAYEEWSAVERVRLRETVQRVLSHLLDHYMTTGDIERGIQIGRRLLALDPLQENVHRALIRLYLGQERRGAALDQYRECCEILRRELGLEPSAKTQGIYKDVVRDSPTLPATGTANRRNWGGAISPAELPSGPAAPLAPTTAPDMPSIAVLPFANMSADPEQEFFSDGITEDIITALSKISRLLVIARNSTFTYKGRAVDVKQVSREQGVRYVLEGSVRRAGSRVRVAAQLIDAKTGHHLWAERYDRDLEDIFAVQDEITREVVIALDVRLGRGEQTRFWSSGTKNLEAWENARLALELIERVTPEYQREARRLCKRALDLDPNYATAWAFLGWTHHNEGDVGIGDAPEESREAALGTAMDYANKALELDPSCADAYCLLGMCHLSNGEYDQAIAMSEKAITLAPSHAESLVVSAVVQNKSGRPERSLELMRKAMRLCPICPVWYLWALGTAYRLTGQTDSAIGAFEATIKRAADYLAAHTGLASTFGELGREEDAKTSVSEVLRLKPDFSIKSYMRGLTYRDPEVSARFEDGLRNAGLPE